MQIIEFSFAPDHAFLYSIFVLLYLNCLSFRYNKLKMRFST